MYPPCIDEEYGGDLDRLKKVRSPKESKNRKRSGKNSQEDR